jgi:hypothetical protein
MACSKHTLEVIMSRGEGYGCDAVVRWCSQCGAIVIDVDCDNRTAPGRIMKMRLPKGEK